MTAPPSRRLTLNGIRRSPLGLEAKKVRRFCEYRVRIWSDEHKAYWRLDAAGYTGNSVAAWVLPFSEAYDRTAHCGPEKHIVYERED